MVIVEVCCGTKSVAKVAAPYANRDMIVYTVDIDPECTPSKARARRHHFIVDLLGGDAVNTPEQLGGINLADLRATLDEHLANGDVILMHGSPPCDQVSVMNTTGHKNRNFPTRLAKSLRVFHAFVDLANRYAVAWTLENPGTGMLWHPARLREHLAPADRWLADVPDIAHMTKVDYCQYGWFMKKETGLAFSSSAMRDAFAPVARRCPGAAMCEMCIPIGHGGRRAHAVSMGNLTGDYDCSTKHARYPIPPALVVHMIGSLRNEADRVLAAAHAAAADAPAAAAPAAAAPVAVPPAAAVPRVAAVPPAAAALRVAAARVAAPVSPTRNDIIDLSDDMDVDDVVADNAAGRGRPNRGYMGPTIGRVLAPFDDPVW